MSKYTLQLNACSITMNGKKQSVHKYTILVKDGIMLCWKLFRKHKYNMQQVSHRHKDMAPQALPPISPAKWQDSSCRMQMMLMMKCWSSDWGLTVDLTQLLWWLTLVPYLYCKGICSWPHDFTGLLTTGTSLSCNAGMGGNMIPIIYQSIKQLLTYNWIWQWKFLEISPCIHWMQGSRICPWDVIRC